MRFLRANLANYVFLRIPVSLTQSPPKSAIHEVSSQDIGMGFKILPVLAFAALAFQASVSFAQQDDSNDNHGGDQTSGGV